MDFLNPVTDRISTTRRILRASDTKGLDAAPSYTQEQQAVVDLVPARVVTASASDLYEAVNVTLVMDYP